MSTAAFADILDVHQAWYLALEKNWNILLSTRAELLVHVHTVLKAFTEFAGYLKKNFDFSEEKKNLE